MSRSRFCSTDFLQSAYLTSRVIPLLSASHPVSPVLTKICHSSRSPYRRVGRYTKQNLTYHTRSSRSGQGSSRSSALPVYANKSLGALPRAFGNGVVGGQKRHTRKYRLRPFSLPLRLFLATKPYNHPCGIFDPVRATLLGHVWEGDCLKGEACLYRLRFERRSLHTRGKTLYVCLILSCKHDNNPWPSLLQACTTTVGRSAPVHPQSSGRKPYVL